jgi:RNA polymerase sigma-32 factor
MTKDLMQMTMGLPVGSLETYLYQIEQIPVLSAEEEHGLAVKFSERADLKAAQALILSHLRYVAYVARQYQGYGLPIADLLQEGTVGLMKAVKRFNPHQGVRLVTFAMHWIKSEIHEFVIRNWRIVKVATTKAQRKLFFNLRRYKETTGWLTANEVQLIAKDLGVDTDEVLEMEKRLYHSDVAYDLVQEDEEEDTFTPSQYLAGPRSLEPSFLMDSQSFSAEDKEKLFEALQQLDERSLAIIQARWLADEKESLKVLSEKFHVSIERIRQIEAKAIEQLSTWMQ